MSRPAKKPTPPLARKIKVEKYFIYKQKNTEKYVQN